MTAPLKGILYLVKAERRIKCVEQRDFSTDRWIRGEGARFWTVERIAALKAENEARRKRK